MGGLELFIQRGTDTPAGRAAAHNAMTDPNSSFWRDTAFVWALAVFSLLLHLATASFFNLYIDELYVMVSSKHSLTTVLPICWMRAAAGRLDDSVESELDRLHQQPGRTEQRQIVAKHITQDDHDHD